MFPFAILLSCLIGLTSTASLVYTSIYADNPNFLEKDTTIITEDPFYKSINGSITSTLSLFCMDHRHNLDDDEETIDKLIKAHGYVIIDEPLALYKWKGGSTAANANTNNNHVTSKEKCDC